MTDATWPRTVSVAPERLSGWIARFQRQHGDVVIGTSESDITMRATDGAAARIEVPFPPLTVATDDLVASLLRHVRVERTVGVLLVRRRGHAVGVLRGRSLLVSKVGTSYVQGKTKAGGWSQQRYARRRANQAQAAYADAAEDAVDLLLPRLEDLDAVVTGGDRVGLRATLADPRLEPLQKLIMLRVLAVPDPRLRVLTELPDQLLAVRIDLNEHA